MQQRPETVYAIYCQRGDGEDQIRELEDDFAIDRTSCSGFRANVFRVVQTAAAYALSQELRWKRWRTELRSAQVGTLRL